MFIAMTVTMLLVVFGAPVLMVLAIRALWYRHVYIGRSAELEKLVWQLHRIASSLESAAAITPPAQTRDVEPQPRPVALSMFGR
jgi:hypothetical protein